VYFVLSKQLLNQYLLTLSLPNPKVCFEKRQATQIRMQPVQNANLNVYLIIKVVLSTNQLIEG